MTVERRKRKTLMQVCRRRSLIDLECGSDQPHGLGGIAMVHLEHAKQMQRVEITGRDKQDRTVQSLRFIHVPLFMELKGFFYRCHPSGLLGNYTPPPWRPAAARRITLR